MPFCIVVCRGAVGRAGRLEATPAVGIDGRCEW